MRALANFSRTGGLLPAIPSGYALPNAILDGAVADETGFLGPSKDIAASFLEEDESGTEVNLDITNTFLALDLDDAALLMLRE